MNEKNLRPHLVDFDALIQMVLSNRLLSVAFEKRNSDKVKLQFSENNEFIKIRYIFGSTESANTYIVHLFIFHKSADLKFQHYYGLLCVFFR